MENLENKENKEIKDNKNKERLRGKQLFGYMATAFIFLFTLYAIIGLSIHFGTEKNVQEQLEIRIENEKRNQKYSKRSLGQVDNSDISFNHFSVQDKDTSFRDLNTLKEEFSFYDNYPEAKAEHSDLKVSNIEFLRAYPTYGIIIAKLTIENKYYQTTEIDYAIDGFKATDGNDFVSKRIIANPFVSKEQNLQSQIFFKDKKGNLTSANGVFIDYKIEENNTFPTKWYFLTNAHITDVNNHTGNNPLYNNNSKEETTNFYISSPNINDEVIDSQKSLTIETKLPKTVFQGTDFLSTKPHDIWNKISEEYEEMIDVGVLEIDFETTEKAQKFFNNVLDNIDKSIINLRSASITRDINNIQTLSYINTSENAPSDDQTTENWINQNTLIYKTKPDSIHQLKNYEFHNNRDYPYKPKEIPFQDSLFDENEFITINNVKYKTQGWKGRILSANFGKGSSGSPVFYNGELKGINYASDSDRKSNQYFVLNTHGYTGSRIYDKSIYEEVKKEEFSIYDLIGDEQMIWEGIQKKFNSSRDVHLKNPQKRYYGNYVSRSDQKNSYLISLLKLYGNDYKTFLIKRVKELIEEPFK
ncbi:DUF31 family putative serine protease [Mycoplasma procyoni]|uniref:DUF31 family putative serine protease n=1 Tax=Mycoplasma procyoni TaxID=568784 RepID=UPI00197B6714|nr:hypothetical protein [Mycoplasma procyoni]MBN3534858.1 hypothetical protein [Mycoplasma procyoni]